MKKLSLLVVGGGSIGQRHIKNIQLLSHEFTLVLDLVEPDVFSRKKGDEFSLRNIFKQLETALSNNRYDIVLICSPNHLHIEQVCMALKHGADVFVEKPLTHDLETMKELLTELENSQRFMMVGCNLRFHPGVTALKQALDNHLIGRPLSVNANFAHYLPNWRPGQDYRNSYSARAVQGGGILFDAIHEPDYLCWMFGKVKSVSGKLRRLGDLDIDVEDTASYVLEHVNNVMTHIHVDFLRRDKSRGCNICGTEGSLVWESTGKNPESVLVKSFDAETSKWNILFEDSAYDLNLQYIDELKYFIGCVINREQPINGIDEAVHVLTILDNVRVSNKTGCDVIINE